MVTLTADQIKRADALRARRWTPSRIAAHLHVPVETVRKHYGLTAPHKTLLTPETEREVKRLFLEGVTMNAISHRLNVGAKVVIRLCRDLTPPNDPRKRVKPRKAKAGQDPVAVQVPRWVPDQFLGTYLNVAERDGEEEAASVCRRLKNGGAIRVVHQRLPLVVSPVGY